MCDVTYSFPCQKNGPRISCYWVSLKYQAQWWVCKWTVEHEEYENSEIYEIGIYWTFVARNVLPFVLVKYLVHKIVLKSLKKVKLEVWFGGQNELHSVEFIWNNICVSWVSFLNTELQNGIICGLVPFQMLSCLVILIYWIIP